MTLNPTRPAPADTIPPDVAADPLHGPPAGSSTIARAEGASAAPGPALGDDCWFLAGPTASGKSALGVKMARELGAEIVSVDSMAVYRGLDVGTAKPTPEQRRTVPHHLVDVVAPGESYNVARWLADAAAAVERIRSLGRRVLFLGGTPLYLRALRDGLAAVPGEDPEFRRAAAAEVAAHGPARLHARLAEVDPEAAARIHPRDTKRIIRALEVEQVTGIPLSRSLSPAPHQVFDRQLLVLDVPRSVLHDRIDRRVERMFTAGIVEETAAALAASGGIGPTAIQAAGYAEAIDFLAGRIDRAAAILRTQQRTRQLAKRQCTWLRSFRTAIWIPS